MRLQWVVLAPSRQHRSRLSESSLALLLLLPLPGSEVSYFCPPEFSFSVTVFSWPHNRRPVHTDFAILEHARSMRGARSFMIILCLPAPSSFASPVADLTWWTSGSLGVTMGQTPGRTSGELSLLVGCKGSAFTYYDSNPTA